MIEVSHLTKKYGSRLAVDDISFTVEDGVIYGLLGPNGAGKSTIMNTGTGANHLGNSTLQNRQGKDHTDSRSRQIAYPVADKQRVCHIIKGTKEQCRQGVRQVPQQTAGHRRSGQRLCLVLRLLAPALTHGAKWQRPPCKPQKHHLYPPSSPDSRA